MESVVIQGVLKPSLNEDTLYTKYHVGNLSILCEPWTPI